MVLRRRLVHAQASFSTEDEAVSLELTFEGGRQMVKGEREREKVNNNEVLTTASPVEEMRKSSMPHLLRRDGERGGEVSEALMGKFFLSGICA